MKTVILMFDSLNRHLLPNYNPDTFVQAPNFERLAERAVTFDRSYVCSMHCMPARRDFHTGRHAYYRAARDSGPGSSNQYTLMPTSMRGYKGGLEDIALADPLLFSKGMRVVAGSAVKPGHPHGFSSPILAFAKPFPPGGRTATDDA